VDLQQRREIFLAHFGRLHPLSVSFNDCGRLSLSCFVSIHWP
jgi:hypothetical protein